MKFEKVLVTLEKYESIDIIATSPEEEKPTDKPVETTKHDPYADDKW